MTANINPDTGIAYGYISANALDPDIVNDLTMGTGGVENFVNVSYEEYIKECLHEYRRDYPACALGDDEVKDERGQQWAEEYESYEEEVSGKLDGVSYASSWLGGALNFWIFQGPYVTEAARRASPCVPNAGILDTLDGDVQSYDVPKNWRREDG